ncbi:MAG: long-chain fatty acid--CoA ligase [Pseudomonadota bacterium]
MLGQMQDWPLRTHRILDHAARYHARRPVISRLPESGAIARTDWGTIHTRARRLSDAFRRLGLKPGDVVGCMAWNTARHLEAWYGIPGAGGVLHTLNPRLGTPDLDYIANHAGNRFLICDPDLAPKIAELAPLVKDLAAVVVLGPNVPEVLESITTETHAADDLIASGNPATEWEAVDERAACGICYTSGTTGNPKGVVYSHRSNTLHAMSMIQPDMLGLSANDVLMPVVPLFHANGWSTGYSGPMAGAAMVMPGRALDPASLCEMFDEGVTITAAVPTVWLPLLAHLRATGRGLPTLERVVIGGSACPRAVIEAFQNDYGVEVLHAWGMTETSPLGSFASLKPEARALPPEQQLDMQETVGHPPFTVDLRVVDDEGAELPRDGQTQGRLQIRGAGVVQRYLGQETDTADAEGWFDTGDAATLDEAGYTRITDRFKDVIKSGGEWISSIDLENAAVAHPDVAEAAAVAMPHPTWDERPVLVIVPRDGCTPDRDSLRGLLSKRFAKWQLPDEILFMEALPHTATGKISKRSLREELAADGYTLPDLRDKA